MQESLCLTPDLFNILLSLSTALVGDGRMRVGLGEYHLDCGIRPVVPFSRMVDTAVTVRLEVANSHSEFDMSHMIKGFESHEATPYPIMVVEVPAQPHRYGVFGEGAATIARANGFVGALVEGAVRDTQELMEMHFPVFSRTISPGHIFAKSVALNQAVTVGGRTIRPHDIIIADNDGIVLIRPDEVEDVIARAQAIQEWERRIHGMLADHTAYNTAIELAGPMP